DLIDDDEIRGGESVLPQDRRSILQYVHETVVEGDGGHLSGSLSFDVRQRLAQRQALVAQASQPAHLAPEGVGMHHHAAERGALTGRRRYLMVKQDRDGQRTLAKQTSWKAWQYAGDREAARFRGRVCPERTF